MIIKKTYKFRLICTDEIKEKLEGFAQCKRFIWNYFVRLNQHRLLHKYRIMRYYEMAHWCTFIKTADEYSFLQECPAVILQQKVRQLEQAYKMGFDKTKPSRLPTFHNNKNYSSFRIPQAHQFPIKPSGKPHGHNININKIFEINVPKIGFIPFIKSREIEGTPKNLTVYKKAGHWYCSIQVELDVTPKPLVLPENSIAIYMGSTNNFAVLTDGKTNISYPVLQFTRIINRLTGLQRNLSSKIKFSRNWDKNVLKLEQRHDLISRKKNDFMHKLSTEISGKYDYVFIETLDLKKMIELPKRKTREQDNTKKPEEPAFNITMTESELDRMRICYRLTTLQGYLVNTIQQLDKNHKVRRKASRRKKPWKTKAKRYSLMERQRINSLHMLSCSIQKIIDSWKIKVVEEKTKMQELADRNKYVLTQAWGAFTTMLTYKCHWEGTKLVVLNKPIKEISQDNLDTCIQAANDILTTGMQTIA